MNAFKNFISSFLSTISELIVPEDVRLKKILTLESATLYNILPKSPVALTDTYVLFEYGNQIVKLLVHTFKYKNHPVIKKHFTTYIYDELLPLISELEMWGGSSPIIVPMPMSKDEKKRKGFNQCEELVRALKEKDSSLTISFQALSKIKETKRQATLTKEERLINVRYSMEADKALVEKKTVIVIDDVYTTLSSFLEAKRALTFAGAKKVVGIFIAH